MEAVIAKKKITMKSFMQWVTRTDLLSWQLFLIDLPIFLSSRENRYLIGPKKFVDLPKVTYSVNKSIQIPDS